MRSRSVPSAENAVLSVTMIHGGDRDNVIPNTVQLTGTLRDFDLAVSARIAERIRDVCDGVAKAHECTVEVNLDSMYPPTVNHAAQTEVVQPAPSDAQTTADEEPTADDAARAAQADVFELM